MALALCVRGRFVVFDRHPYDLMIAEPAKGAGARLRRWLLLHACLRPDLVLVLDAPPQVLHSRKAEHAPERLEIQRERYRSLSGIGSEIVLLDTSSGEERTALLAGSRIWDAYRRHLTPGSR